MGSGQVRAYLPANWRCKNVADNQNHDFNPFGVENTEALKLAPFAPVFSYDDTRVEQTPAPTIAPPAAGAALIFQAPEITPLPPLPATDDEDEDAPRPRRRNQRGDDDQSRPARRRTRSRQSDEEDETAPVAESDSATDDDGDEDEDAVLETARRRRRRRPRAEAEEETGDITDEVTSVKGSTRLEAKRQRRRETRRDNRRRTSVTESEFLARRESVKREMVVREKDGLNQIAVLEDGLLVEHYVARRTQQTMVGNIYLGRVQNVLPSMEAAFVDLGKGRNAVLYAGEVNWDAAGMAGRPRRIEQALKSGDTVLVQVTKDPIGHKGARLTAQITLAGRYLVLVPGGQMTGISRKLPDKERNRLKKLLGSIVPKDYGVIVRTAAEGASEAQLRGDVERLQAQWQQIEKKQKGGQKAPALLRAEPELAVRVVRDVFNEDFTSLIVQGKGAWETIDEYVRELSPDLVDRLQHWVKKDDVFAAHRIDEQLTKGMDRKVWLPSGGSLIIDRTEAMTVIDVNTGKFIGSGGTLEETVTKNNLEAAEEIVRQLRLRDIGGIVVIDFVDMVLEANRDLVLRRLVECLGRDRTRHQVTEITSLGLVQMTRKRVGEGLVEAFSTPCECCEGRGFIVHDDPVEREQGGRRADRNESSKGARKAERNANVDAGQSDRQREQTKSALSAIAAAAASSHQDDEDGAAVAPESDAGKKTKKQEGKGKGNKAKSAGSQENESSAQSAAKGEGKAPKTTGGAHKGEAEADSRSRDDKAADNPGNAKGEHELETSKQDSQRGAVKHRGESRNSKRDCQVHGSKRGADSQRGSHSQDSTPESSVQGSQSEADAQEDAAGEEPPVTHHCAPTKRKRSGRRAATMSAGKPATIELPPVQESAPTIAHPAALSVDDIELPQARPRAANKTRRVVMENPQTEAGEKK